MFENVLLGLRDPLKRTNVQKIHLVFFFLKQESHIQNEEYSGCSQEPFDVKEEEEEGRGAQQQGIENDRRGQA